MGERGLRLALLWLAAHSAMAAQHGEEDMMSQRDVERTLGRLLTDQGFRDAFFRDPARTCLVFGLQLASQEAEALFQVPRSALAELAGRIDDRICRLHIQRGESARPSE